MVLSGSLGYPEYKKGKEIFFYWGNMISPESNHVNSGSIFEQQTHNDEIPTNLSYHATLQR